VAIREGQRGGNETPEAIGSFITIPVTASGPAYAGNTIGASPSYSMTAQVALVHVDRKTGEVQVKKIWAAHDCGRPINPDAVRGQIEGSVSMGDSEARFECMTYEPDHGLLVQSNLLGHLIATSLDAPEVESFIIETEDPMSPHGAKEAGEGPLLPTAPAIANAVAEAIGGGRVSMLPLTPDRVLAVIRQHEKENSSC
jgi:CO/xanthine dehydrogenase Mo-binding subunit